MCGASALLLPRLKKSVSSTESRANTFLWIGVNVLYKPYFEAFYARERGVVPKNFLHFRITHGVQPIGIYAISLGRVAIN